MGLLNLGFTRIPQDNELFSREDPSKKATALAFLHIPRTSGTWFTSFLMQHFKPDEVAPLPGIADTTYGSDPSKRLFRGHFRFPVIDTSRPLRLVTFLRDPFERTASHYRAWHKPDFFSKDARARAGKDVMEAVEWVQGSTYEEFVSSDNPIVVGCIRDVQTVYLTSEPDPSHPEFLKSAIRNVERKFFFVGLQELSAESIQLFQYQTGSTLQPLFPVHNVSKSYDVSLSAAGKERLRELLKNDVVLYEAGRRLFARRLAAMSRRLKKVA